MSKELLIMRHAKSCWKDESLNDHDRPLNRRGSNDAPQMGRYLKANSLIPDAVYSSSAKRASSTANIMCEQWLDDQIQPAFCEDFYLAPPEIYIDYLSHLDDSSCRPMLIGHNPGLEHLIYALTGTLDFMSTAAIAHLTLPIDRWQQIRTALNRCELNAVFRPRELF